jgi:O-antigen/teichoic acid export membrane protein
MRWVPTLTPRRLRQLWYAPLLALAMGLMLVRTLVIARVLDVREFAGFSGGILVSGTFCMLGCLGLQPMLQREWPVHLVRRQELRAVVRAVQCHVVGVGCFIAALLAVAVGLVPTGLTPALLAVGLLHGLSQQVFLVVTVESRSRGEALRFGRQNFVRAVVALGVSVGAAWGTGSALIALAADAMVTLGLSIEFFRQALVHVNHRVGVVGRLALRRLRRVNWRSALTLMSVTAVGFAVLNADRWVASARLGVAGFAHYSFAWIVLSIAQGAQVVVNASVYPMLARRFADQGRKVAFRVCLYASGAILLAGVSLSVPVALALDYGIARWYPQYLDAVVLMPWFIAIAVLRVSDFWTSFLLICGFESQLLKINLVTAAIAGAAWLLFTSPWGDGLATLQQVAMLAVMLTVVAYLFAAGTAWRVSS